MQSLPIDRLLCASVISSHRRDSHIIKPLPRHLPHLHILVVPLLLPLLLHPLDKLVNQPRPRGLLGPKLQLLVLDTLLRKRQRLHPQVPVHRLAALGQEHKPQLHQRRPVLLPHPLQTRRRRPQQQPPELNGRLRRHDPHIGHVAGQRQHEGMAVDALEQGVARGALRAGGLEDGGGEGGRRVHGLERLGQLREDVELLLRGRSVVLRPAGGEEVAFEGGEGGAAEEGLEDEDFELVWREAEVREVLLGALDADEVGFFARVVWSVLGWGWSSGDGDVTAVSVKLGDQS